MTNPLVSVIIPVYRVEKYLNQCVDSALTQTYQNIEIILVDDGSPDNSGAICDAYAVKDSRIKVIHKENGGLSSARNAGIRAANGEFVLFLDSDDYYFKDECIENLINKTAEDEYDIVLFQSLNAYIERNKFFDNEGEYDLNVFKDKDKNKIFRYLIQDNKAIATAVNKLIRRKVIQDNDLYFKEGIISEDIDWAVRLFLAATKVTAINEMVYVYRMENVSSITHNVSEKTIDDNFNTIQVVIGWFQEQHDEFAKMVFSYMAFIYATLYCNIAKHGDIAKFAEVKQYDWLFRYAIDRKTKLVRLVYHLFGFERGIKIIGKMRELRKKVRTR